MTYTLRKAFKRNCLLIRGVLPERTVDYKRFPRESQVAVFDGKTFLITHRLAKTGTCAKEVTPYKGCFQRVVLFFRNLIDTIKGLN